MAHYINNICYGMSSDVLELFYSLVRPIKNKREELEIWLVSFVGGFIGSVFMDFTETRMSKFGISSGVTDVYIGRWVKGMLSGTLIHQDIVKTNPVKNEARIGQIFHFVIGGGVVALFYPLFYPLFFELISFGGSSNHLVLAMIFGLITSLLPWFVLMPSFGWGVFGSKAPAGARPFISPVLSHIPYGFGIGLTLVIYYAVMA